MGMTFVVGRRVTGYDDEGPSVVLGDGETVEADLILAGDGRLVSLYTSGCPCCSFSSFCCLASSCAY
jgi:hypothetical protein